MVLTHITYMWIISVVSIVQKCTTDELTLKRVKDGDQFSLNIALES